VTLGNRYGAGAGQIWLDDVNCQGGETSIAQCAHRGWASENCHHDEDVSILCNNGTSVITGKLSYYLHCVSKKFPPLNSL